MNNLRKTAAILALTLALGLVTPILGDSGCTPGNISTPCACTDPGEIHTPPCSSAQYATNDDSADPGDMQGPGYVNVATVAEETLFQLLIF